MYCIANQSLQLVPGKIFIMTVLFHIKLLSENKLVICALGNLHHQISREKFEPEPGFEPGTSRSLDGALPIKLSRFNCQFMLKPSS